MFRAIRRLSLAFLVAVLATPLATWANEPPATTANLPDTPAGKAVAAWLAAVNSGSVSTLRDFIANNYAEGALAKIPLADRLERQSGLMKFNGRLALLSVGEDGTKVHCSATFLAERPETTVSIAIDLQPDPPHKILGTMIRPGGPAPGSKPLPEAELSAYLDGYIDRLAKKDVFSGAVMIAKGGKTVYSKAVGLRNKGENLPNLINTKFDLGSMNKMITSVAVAQLVQAGKLSYDAKIETYLPDLPKDKQGKITLHHLLTHTAGMPDYFNEEFMAGNLSRWRSVNDFLKLFIDKPLEFEPGTDWSYSNGGFMLAGAIIEKVTGQTYDEYVLEHIYKPAGMTNTWAYENDRPVPNFALGYTPMEEPGDQIWNRWRTNLMEHSVRGGPAGGGYSTVEDLCRFAEALTSYKLLDKGHTDIILEGKVATPMSADAKYAYGFEDSRKDSRRVVGHSGGFTGINGDLRMYLDNGYVVAVLANYDPPAAQVVSAQIGAVLPVKEGR